MVECPRQGSMDPRLVIRAQQGDEAAFAELTVAVSGRLLRIAYGILRDRGLAEDATQQALVDVWRKLPGLRDAGRFEARSYRLLVHACYAERVGTNGRCLTLRRCAKRSHPTRSERSSTESS